MISRTVVTTDSKYKVVEDDSSSWVMKLSPNDSENFPSGQQVFFTRIQQLKIGEKMILTGFDDGKVLTSSTVVSIVED